MPDGGAHGAKVMKRDGVNSSQAPSVGANLAPGAGATSGVKEVCQRQELAA